MRILYQNGKLLVSLSDDEVDKFYKNKHTPVELPIGFLKVLHEDITRAMQKAWREKVEENYGEK
jgi:hypothetical protein|tara:strand:- start:1304 stop:1495 length:192 start_codon:yes stop_codon:yes gene_type:complete